MPVVFGEMVASVEDIVRVFQRYGDRVRGTYRAYYQFGPGSDDPYSGVRLERPLSLRENPADVTYPWEQILVAAAACAGSDYPMLAAHFGIPLERVEFIVDGVFDPRGEFDGLHGFRAPADSRHCFLSLAFRTTLFSPASRPELAALHERVLAHNMVLGALRGIPWTSELETRAASSGVQALATAASGGGR